TINAETATITGGTGNDSINLNVAANGGEDTIVFGNVTYNALQVKSDGNGVDIINGFNFEGGGAGAEDILDFTAFLTVLAVWITTTSPTVTGLAVSILSTPSLLALMTV